MVRFNTTTHGNLEVAGMNQALRKCLLWGGAAGFVVAMAFAVLAVNNESLTSLAESCAEGFLALGGVSLLTGIGGRSPIIFDAKKGEIRSGNSVVAHFANLKRILLIDRLHQEDGGIFITLEFQTGRRFNVGRDYDEFTAASLAAAIARLTGRPVEQSLN